MARYGPALPIARSALDQPPERGFHAQVGGPAPHASPNYTRVNKQYDQRADERHEPTRRVALLVHASHSADRAAEPRTHETKNHRHYQAHVLPAGHDSTGQQTNDQPESGVSDHVQHAAFILLILLGLAGLLERNLEQVELSVLYLHGLRDLLAVLLHGDVVGAGRQRDTGGGDFGKLSAVD